MSPALLILGPVIVISLLWIIAESQADGGRLGQWYDQAFGVSRPEEREEPGRGARPSLRAPGSSRPYSWGDDPDLYVELFRAELAALPETPNRRTADA